MKTVKFNDKVWDSYRFVRWKNRKSLIEEWDFSQNAIIVNIVDIYRLIIFRVWETDVSNLNFTYLNLGGVVNAFTLFEKQ